MLCRNAPVLLGSVVLTVLKPLAKVAIASAPSIPIVLMRFSFGAGPLHVRPGQHKPAVLMSMGQTSLGLNLATVTERFSSVVQTGTVY